MKEETSTHTIEDEKNTGNFEFWDEQNEEFKNIDEELGIDTEEFIEVEHLEDLDGWDAEDLEKGISRRRELLENDFNVENPDKSVIGLYEEQGNWYDKARHRIADFVDFSKDNQNAALNLASIIGAYGLSKEIQMEAINAIGSSPQDELSMIGIGLPAFIAGFGSVGATKIGFDRGRSKIADEIRPSKTGGVTVIDEELYDEFNKLVQDSGTVEVQNVTGTTWELEDTHKGSWFHDYLTTRHEQPRLYNLWFEYDSNEQELRYAFDLIIDWNEECPVDIGDNELGSVDAYRFRGKLDSERPEHIENILDGKSHQSIERKIEEVYGQEMRELLDNYGYFDKSVKTEEERITRPEGYGVGDSGTIIHVNHYPVNSEKK